MNERRVASQFYSDGSIFDGNVRATLPERWKECDRSRDRTGFSATFEENRNHLRGVAYRMLGSVSEADDVVQETWLRLSRAGASGLENLLAWLTTA